MCNSSGHRCTPTPEQDAGRGTRSTARNGSRIRTVVACAALVLVTACQRADEPVAAKTESSGELEWARSALGRNPNLEVVAADSASEVITVRNKHTDEVLALKLSEIAAAPLSQLARPVAAPVPAAPQPPEAPAAPGAGAAPPTDAAGQPAERTAMKQEPEAETKTPSAATEQAPGYTIERSDGQIRVSGPGVSIVSSGAPSADSGPQSAQRAIDPIICEGRRMLQLDSRDIYVEGTAITARGGCELYITNSRVIGTEAGVLVEDAIVHIANSYVEGTTASFVASNAARVFIRNSTFQGVSRRGEQATVQDQGGNRWR